MPRNIETFTTCAGPGVAKSHNQLPGPLGTIVTGWLSAPVLTVGSLVAIVMGIVWAAGPLGWCIAAVGLIVLLEQFKDWYYNERLLCIRNRDCAIGTVISEPVAATDGDRKLNIMPAPYSQFNIEYETLIPHIDRNRGMLSDPANFGGSAPPVVPTAAQLTADRRMFRDYMRRLESASKRMFNQLTIGVVDTLMDDPNRNFYNRFYRKDSAHITDPATWNAIPTDHENINWQGVDAQSMIEENNPYEGLNPDTQGLNPMFRYSNRHGDNVNEREPMVPYLHCEIEGNRLEVIIDEVITGLVAFAIGCAILGPVGGAIVGAIAWFLRWLWNAITGNDGNAAEPDIDWDDPDFTGVSGVTETSGDVVVVYGNWIMDTEHYQYFEIHPVRAYYIVASNALGNGDPTLVSTNEDQVVAGGNFDPTLVTAADAERICKVVSHAEEQGPNSNVPATQAIALSHGMNP